MSISEAAKYFDKERIEANPDMTFLSPLGAETVLEWMDILEDEGYTVESPLGIADSAAFLIANGHSDIDITSTRIMLAYLACAMDTLDGA